LNLAYIVIRDIALTSAESNEPVKYSNIVEGYIRSNLRGIRYITTQCKICSLNIKEFAFLFPKYENKIESGVLSGDIKMWGQIDKLDADIHLNLLDGKFKNLEFRSLTATRNGKDNILKIEDGKIMKTEGNFILNGEIDLRLIPAGRALQNIQIEPEQNIAMWDGWDITNNQKTASIRASKKIGKDDVLICFERQQNVNDIDPCYQKPYGDRDRSEMDVVFMVDKNENLKMRFNDEESFLGVERNVKF